MSFRSIMTHRCRIVRNEIGKGGQLDGWNQSVYEERVVSKEQPCYFIETTSSLNFINHKAAVFAKYRMFLPRDADIQENDVVDGVHSKNGKVLYDTKMTVRGVVNLRTHISVTLEELR